MAAIPEGIIVLWPGANNAIPSGWDRVTALDTKYFKGRTSGDAGTGGANTHNHLSAAHFHAGPTHDHTVTSGARNHNCGGWTYGSSNKPDTGGPHTHAPSVGNQSSGNSGNNVATWSTPTSEPANYIMIAIESDGTPSGFPDDSVVFYNSSNKSSPEVPTDWVHYTASAGRFIKAPTGGGNSSSGAAAAAHVHTANNHPHNAPGNHDHAGGNVNGNLNEYTISGSQWCGPIQFVTNHTHTFDTNAGAAGAAGNASSADTAGETYVPPYHILLGIQNTSGADNWLEEAIVMWDGAAGSPPDDWTLCNGGNNDSGNATPDLNGKYILTWASGGGNINVTGGTAGHDHTDPTGHGHSQAHSHGAANFGRSGEGGGWTCGSGGANNNRGTAHTHTGSNSSTNNTVYSNKVQTVCATANTEPAYRTVAFLSAPEEPSSASGNMAMFGANF